MLSHFLDTSGGYGIPWHGGGGSPPNTEKQKRDYSPYSLSDNPCLSVCIIYYSSVIVCGDRE